MLNVLHTVDFGTNKNNCSVQKLASLIKISDILNLQNKIYIFFHEINTYCSTHLTEIVRF